MSKRHQIKIGRRVRLPDGTHAEVRDLRRDPQGRLYVVTVGGVHGERWWPRQSVRLKTKNRLTDKIDPHLSQDPEPN